MSSVFTKILGNLHFASGSLRFKGPVRNLESKQREGSTQRGKPWTGIHQRTFLPNTCHFFWTRCYLVDTESEYDDIQFNFVANNRSSVDFWQWDSTKAVQRLWFYLYQKRSWNPTLTSKKESHTFHNAEDFPAFQPLLGNPFPPTADTFNVEKWLVRLFTFWVLTNSFPVC